MTITKERQEATRAQQEAQAQREARAASDGAQAEQAGEQAQNRLWRAEDLSDFVTLEAGAGASELRVDECTASTEQGQTKVRRVGLPPTGAKPGVTYRNVQVSIEVKGGPPRRTTRSG